MRPVFLGALKFYAGPEEGEGAVRPTSPSPWASARAKDNGFGLDVKIKVDLPGIDKDVAEDLIAGGHKVCPYSHATSGTLKITPELA